MAICLKKQYLNLLKLIIISTLTIVIIIIIIISIVVVVVIEPVLFILPSVCLVCKLVKSAILSLLDDVTQLVERAASCQGVPSLNPDQIALIPIGWASIVCQAEAEVLISVRDRLDAKDGRHEINDYYFSCLRRNIARLFWFTMHAVRVLFRFASLHQEQWRNFTQASRSLTEHNSRLIP